MKRLEPRRPNTPAAFDAVWEQEMAANRRQFDLYRFRAMMAGIPAPADVIELGCGCSEFLSFMLNHRPDIVATGLDFSSWAISYMQQIDPRVRWLRADALQTTFSDARFDVVLAGELIEHLPEPVKLLQEMRRLTRPGGFARVTTPLPHIAPQDLYHVWAFELRDLLELLVSAGFEGGHVDEVGNYLVATGRVNA